MASPTQRPRPSRRPAPSAASQRTRVIMLERMSSFAVRDIAERILDSALKRAGLAFVPMGGARLASFVHGPVQDLVRHHLGDDSADALLEDLQPLLALSLEDDEVSSVRPRNASGQIEIDLPFADSPSQISLRADIAMQRPPKTDAPTVRPETNSELVVIVSSLDPSRVYTLGAAFGEGVDVRIANDLVELEDMVNDSIDKRPYLVLDGSAPALHAATLAATLPELPEGVTIVLWGYDVFGLDEVYEIVEGSTSFPAFGPEVDEEELAAKLRLA